MVPISEEHQLLIRYCNHHTDSLLTYHYIVVHLLLGGADIMLQTKLWLIFKSPLLYVAQLSGNIIDKLHSCTSFITRTKGRSPRSSADCRESSPA